MNRKSYIVSFLVLTIAGLGGCSKQPAATSQTASATRDKIQGKVQINLSESSADDSAMNAGGSSVYLWEGPRRYRLFFKTRVDVEAGKEYMAEGVYAQKAIDEIGDPDQGKNGYPLQSSCDRVVRMAWSGQAFDVADGQASVLRAKVKRYPARPVFLVTRIQPVASKDDSANAKKAAQANEEDVPEINVPAEQLRALLIEGPATQTAPLWEAAGGTVRCKVTIGTNGKISELQTGAQLCEAVPWPQFRYQPQVQRGHPVKVNTEVEVHFEPRSSIPART